MIKKKDRTYKTDSGDKVDLYEFEGIPHIKLDRQRNIIIDKIVRFIEYVKQWFVVGYANLSGTNFFPYVRPNECEEESNYYENRY